MFQVNILVPIIYDIMMTSFWENTRSLIHSVKEGLLEKFAQLLHKTHHYQSLMKLSSSGHEMWVDRPTQSLNAFYLYVLCAGTHKELK